MYICIYAYNSVSYPRISIFAENLGTSTVDTKVLLYCIYKYG